MRARGLTTATVLGLPSANLLWEPEALTTKAGHRSDVHSFLASVPARKRRRPAPVPAKLPHRGAGLDRWLWPPSLRPRVGWDAGLRAAWTPVRGARARLNRFVRHGLPEYARCRDRPDLDATRACRPIFTSGRSARALLECRRARRRWPPDDRSVPLPARACLAGVRASSSSPTSPTRPGRRCVLRSPVSLGPAISARAWRRGLTGYPLVDAGMRQLWATVFMHNRVRWCRFVPRQAPAGSRQEWARHF